MVNNSTNISKTNNHISPKESLNSDGQQFYQYQQNEHSPLTLTHWTQMKTQEANAVNKWVIKWEMFSHAMARTSYISILMISTLC